MNRIFIYNLAAFLLLLAFSQLSWASDPHIELWRYGPAGSDDPVECSLSLVFSIYPDETLGEFCYCKKIVEGEGAVYKWCQIDGGACGTSASCD
jgi:hypothetical protein